MEILFVLIILAAALILFAGEVIPIDLTALLIMGALIASGILSVEEGVSGFSNPAPLTVAAVLVLSAGMIKTGTIVKLGGWVSKFGGSTEIGQLSIIMLAVGFLSSFINNTAAVAMFLPVVLGIAKEKRISPSRLLIPLSFAGILGGVCTYIGTSTNIIVGSIVEKNGLAPFQMFEFSGLGVLFLAAGSLYLLTIGRKLLPTGQIESTLTENYHLREYLTELIIRRASPLIGKTLQQTNLGSSLDIEVLEVMRGGQKIWSLLQEVELKENDILVVKGNVQNLLKVGQTSGVDILAQVKLGDQDLESDQVALAEAIISPTSDLVGLTLKEADFRMRYQATALAIRRHGEEIKEKLGRIKLKFGDMLLIQGQKDRLKILKQNPSFLLIMEEMPIIDVRHPKFLISISILVGVVLLASLNILPIMVAALFGALLMILTRCLTLQEAYEAVDLRIVVLIAGTLSLGLALEKTGGAKLIADNAVRWAGPFGPTLVLSALYLLTSLLTEVMSNNASAALLTPIALSIAADLQVNPRPFAFAIAYAASASFLTPIGYQTNTLVYGPGGYKFMDFVRVGGPLNFINWIMATILIPIFWPF
jgi:di/tricarboxylate transporter